MKIRWSSESAQEMLSRLGRADQGLADCLRLATLVNAALEAANPDGENKALNQASTLFADCMRKLQRLGNDLEMFESAVQRADGRFEDAEMTAMRAAEQIGAADAAPVYQNGGRFMQWDPAAFTVMPDMRLHYTTTPPAWMLKLDQQL